MRARDKTSARRSVRDDDDDDDDDDDGSCVDGRTSDTARRVTARMEREEEEEEDDGARGDGETGTDDDAMWTWRRCGTTNDAGCEWGQDGRRVRVRVKPWTRLETAKTRTWVGRGARGDRFFLYVRSFVRSLARSFAGLGARFGGTDEAIDGWTR